MKKLLLVPILAAIFSCGDDGGDQSSPPSNDLTLIGNVHFANAAYAREILTVADDFTASWSLFDIHARLQDVTGTKEDLLTHISAQATDWKADEQEKISRVVNNIHNSIVAHDLQLKFDYDIHFVKTTGDEEGGASGYTRQNFIVLNDNVLSSSDDDLARLVSHELFHIISRNNETLRKEMYSIIGFDIENAIPVPDQLKDLKMTNPDAPLWNSFITLTDTDDEISEYVMITYSQKPYDGGSFISYLNVGFLRVKGNTAREVDYTNGNPVIKAYGDFRDFYDQVGTNTNYTIHPEEILADNFALAITEASGLPSTWVVDEMKSKLK